MGDWNEGEVYVDGHQCIVLLHTGSHVSTVSEGFLKKYLPCKRILSCTDFRTIEGAGGTTISYLEYCEVLVESSFKDSAITAPLLITPETSYSRNVPLIIGINIQHRWMDQAGSSTSSPLMMAYRAIHRWEQHLDTSGVIYRTAYLHWTTVLEPGEVNIMDADIWLTVPIPKSVVLVQYAGRCLSSAVITPAFVDIDDDL